LRNLEAPILWATRIGRVKKVSSQKTRHRDRGLIPGRSLGVSPVAKIRIRKSERINSIFKNPITGFFLTLQIPGNWAEARKIKIRENRGKINIIVM
jgi:hypothetical protein